MSLKLYQCTRCGHKELAFDGELKQGNCGPALRWCHNFDIMPPNPNIVVATALYMQDYQLDSWHTVYELDRQLNFEAREEKEMQVYQHHKANA